MYHGNAASPGEWVITREGVPRQLFQDVTITSVANPAHVTCDRHLSLANSTDGFSCQETYLSLSSKWQARSQESRVF